jgi:uncharacterized protein
MTRLAVSVVIPVLNEQHLIEACVQSLRQLAPAWQIIMVDGGSHDNSVARASCADLVLQGKGGRGAQMRLGADHARHPILMFLHVDCQLPEDVESWVQQTVSADHWVAGAFQVRHRCTLGASWWKRKLIRIADRRSRKTLYPYGDQAVFLKKENYLRVGGMPNQPLMEDLEFAKQLRKLGNLRIVPAEVRVFARRFERAPVRTVLCWWTFPLLYRLGISAKRLAGWYEGGKATSQDRDSQ